jgi:hypothetical protein
MGAALLVLALRPPARAVIHYVSVAGSSTPPYTSWSTAATSVHVAVGYAVPGATIIVAKASYDCSTELWMTNPVTIRGYSGPQQTMLDGGNLGRCARLAASNVVLDGISFVHGHADYGGGLYGQGNNILITNCIFRNNTAWYGGGLFLRRSDALVTHCTIVSNIAYNPDPPTSDWPKSGGGGVFCEDAPTRFERCLIAHNRSTNAAANGEGGGMLFFRPDWTSSMAATAVVAECVVSNNWTDYTGGGVACFGWDFYTTDFYDVQIHRTLFAGNSAQHGGGFYHCYWGTRPVLYNCLLKNNTASGNGAGIRIYSTYYDELNQQVSRYENCTVIYNADTNNYAVFASGSVMEMYNCIVWSNDTLSAIRTDPDGLGAQQNVSYSCVEGGYAGMAPAPGNINTNPLFADTEAQDWCLTADSPCIDRGTNHTWMWTDVDYPGRARIFNGRVDMGAGEACVEFDTGAVSSGLHMACTVIPGGVYDWQVTTNPANESWSSISALFTTAMKTAETMITNRATGRACYRLRWHPPY